MIEAFHATPDDHLLEGTPDASNLLLNLVECSLQTQLLIGADIVMLFNDLVSHGVLHLVLVRDLRFFVDSNANNPSLSLQSCIPDFLEKQVGHVVHLFMLSESLHR